MRGLVLAMATLTMASLAAADVIDQFPNPCPEGQYLDLQSACAPLLRLDVGFQRADFLAGFAPFASNVQTLSQCGEAELAAALASVAQSGGGIVVIPACTISVSGKLGVPSNTILRGSGPDTRLVAAPGFATHLLEVETSHDVVIQDLFLVGASALGKGIVIRRSANVLVERLSLDAFGHSNVVFRNSRNITIRYVQSTNAKDFHGIESKDCTVRDPAIPDLWECAAAAQPYGFGSMFTHHYSVYSNQTSGNGDYGIDIHASSGEVAGNLSVGNANAAKFPDAMNVLIHHNRFDSGAGLNFYSTYVIPGRTVRDVVMHRNEFRILKGTYTIRNDEQSDGVYLIDNAYDVEDLRWVTNPGNSVYACPQSDDVQLVGYGDYSSQNAPDQLCAATELPEPSSPAMLTVALPLLALLARRRARRPRLATAPGP